MNEIKFVCTREPVEAPSILLRLDDYENLKRWEKFDAALERHEHNARLRREEDPNWHRKLEVVVRWYYPTKSLDQLALLFSLCKILALENEGRSSEGLKMAYYEGLLELYAPEETTVVVNPRTHEVDTKKRTKRASEMNTLELSVVIEGAFRELSEMGVSMENSRQIRDYYIEWRNWRGIAKRDKLEETYKSVEEYRARVPMCEATISEKGEHLAHIISKGAGGPTVSWNLLHLSVGPHLLTQHTKGWIQFLTMYPHLMGKVNAARDRMGLPKLNRAEDLTKDVMGWDK